MEGRNFIHVGTDGDHSTVFSPLIATTQQTPRLCYKYWIGYNDAFIRDDGRSPFELTIEELYTDSKVIREYRYNNTNLSISRDSGWQTETIDLIGYENSLIKIGFVAASPSHLRFLDVVAVDSFSIVNAPSCVPPASVIATVYAGDSLKLTWLYIKRGKIRVFNMTNYAFMSLKK